MVQIIVSLVTPRQTDRHHQFDRHFVVSIPYRVHRDLLLYLCIQKFLAVRDLQSEECSKNCRRPATTTTSTSAICFPPTPFGSVPTNLFTISIPTRVHAIGAGPWRVWKNKNDSEFEAVICALLKLEVGAIAPVRYSHRAMATTTAMMQFPSDFVVHVFLRLINKKMEQVLVLTLVAPRQTNRHHPFDRHFVVSTIPYRVHRGFLLCLCIQKVLLAVHDLIISEECSKNGRRRPKSPPILTICFPPPPTTPPPTPYGSAATSLFTTSIPKQVHAIAAGPWPVRKNKNDSRFVTII